MAFSAPIIKRSILFEVKSCPYMFYAGFPRALLSSEHVCWTLTPLRACPALPYPTLAARGQDKRTPTYPTHEPDPLTTAPPLGKPKPSQISRDTLTHPVGLGARAQGERRAASIARGSRRTRSEKRSGCITRQCWSSRLSRPGVCEGTLSVSVSVSGGYRLRPP